MNWIQQLQRFKSSTIQDKAFENADFVYTKNWSNYNDYYQ
jgi:ornithine carbamoyltransferase